MAKIKLSDSEEVTEHIRKLDFTICSQEMAGFS